MPGTKARLFAACDQLAGSRPGYDQGQRWGSYSHGKIVPNGEVDCSSSCGIIAKVAGYPIDLTGTFYTGNFKAKMVAAGFTAIRFRRLSDVRPGDFVLGKGHVVFARSATRWWSAEVGEGGKTRGGKAGNQGDRIGFRKPYPRSRGWQWILRPPADPKPVTPPKPPAQKSTTVTIGQANCQSYNGDKSATAWRARGQRFKAQGADVWLLQETSDIGRKLIAAELGPSWRYYSLAGKSVCVMVNTSTVKVAGKHRDKLFGTPFGHGAIAMPCTKDGIGFDAISNHTRPGSKATPAGKAADARKSAGLARGWPAILGGDFNLSDPPLPKGWRRITARIDTLDDKGTQALDSIWTNSARVTVGKPKLLGLGTLSDHSAWVVAVTITA